MATIIRPNVTGYGNSFSNVASEKLNDHQSPDTQEIDLDNLNKTKQSDVIEFTNFEEEVRDYVLASLGHPVTRVELNDHQLKICIDEAVTELDYHAPHFTRQYAVFNTTGGYNLYEIPNYILRNLVYVTFKKTLLSIWKEYVLLSAVKPMNLIYKKNGFFAPRLEGKFGLFYYSS